MLRASYVGLTFTYGISRYTLYRSHQVLRRLPGHETLLPISDMPRPHSTTTVQMASRVPTSGGSPKSTSPVPPHTFPVPEAKSSTSTSASRTKPKKKSKAASPRRTHLTTNKEIILALKAAVLKPRVALKPVQEHQPSKGAQLPQQPPKPAVRNLSPSAFRRRGILQERSRRWSLYEKLVKCPDLDDAWKTYQELLQDCPSCLKQPIPQKHLHGFASRLVTRSEWVPPSRTRTQTTFLRLLSVLSTVYHTGGQVRLWEWNALIDAAGSGWHKTRVADFNSSFNVYQDMVANRAPGASLSDEPYVPLHDHSRVASQPVAPDIVTYTTLLAIAAATRKEYLLHKAEAELLNSGLPPNRSTLFTYLRYYANRGKLSGVRATLGRMKSNGFVLGLDGVNMCLWAYGRNGRLDIAALIYRILRHHLLAGVGDSPESRADYQDAVKELDELEDLTIPPHLKPDAVTYYTLIQVYAYRGRLRESLVVLEHMMTSPHRVTGKLEDVDMRLSGPVLPNPILPIFRALFLGFARHAILPEHSCRSLSAAEPHEKPHSEVWTLDQLRTLFDNFIDLPQEARPSSRTVYWLLVAFAIASGYDRALLRNVWEKLAERYGTVWDGRIEVFRAKIYEEQFDLRYFEGVRTSRDRYKDP
ncbi:hypothetical protein BD309DRAFT_947216 [Dichomitus squalens]|nr:hypothetical protein BD309DRAFT_947216 [Dichomitus squalens]